MEGAPLTMQCGLQIHKDVAVESSLPGRQWSGPEIERLQERGRKLVATPGPTQCACTWVRAGCGEAGQG